MQKLLTNLRVGFFLALKHIQRSSIWTNALITAVMTLTFLNLVVITGILVGLIAGAVQQYEEHYTGDIIISNLIEKETIQQSSRVLNTLDSFEEVENYTPRYIYSSRLEANYQTRTDFTDVPDQASALLTGINPTLENSVTELSQFVVEGEYLNPNDEGQILLGSDLLAQYARDSFFVTLEDIKVGSKVRANINGITREYTVKGIIQSKLGEVGLSAYILDNELRNILNRDSYDYNEIAVDLKPGTDPILFKEKLIASGVGELALVETSRESQGDFLQEIEITFGLLGTIVSGIGLGVGLITIFIVIFINAISRQKYIGIMKGIGINATAIEMSYLFQAVFYSLAGTLIGLVILLGFLQPYIARNPIDFPFSDGILIAPFDQTLIRIIVLFVATMIAAYIPSRMIIKKNTLNSILGR